MQAAPLHLNVGIDEQTAWDKALENLSADTHITSLGKILADIQIVDTLLLVFLGVG